MARDEIYYRIIDTPCGSMIVGWYADALIICDWIGESGSIGRNALIVAKYLDAQFIEAQNPPHNIFVGLNKARAQIHEYFEGVRTKFNIPIKFVGTSFRQKVWEELLNIPYGERLSYLTVAEKLKCPKSVRAVAGAIGANPLSIIVPCHRVVGKNGALTGYAGGIPAKRLLLGIESSKC